MAAPFGADAGMAASLPAVAGETCSTLASKFPAILRLSVGGVGWES